MTKNRMGRRAPRDEGGAAALEFALIVPVLLLLVFGMVQYSLFFWAKQGGADVARHAARLAAVGEPATCSGFRTAVQTRVDAFDASTGSVTIKRSYTNVTGTPVSAVQVGDVVTVQVAFNTIDLGIPFVPFIDGGRVTETATARVEHVPAAPEAC